MQVLIIGGGGREHALAWKAAQSMLTSQIFVAPGNAGTQLEPMTENVPIAADDIAKLLAFALEKQIDLTIVGPEVPLVNGIVDRFEEAGLKIFGPCAAAAQLEGSKSFTKDFLARHNIPTADYQVFSDVALAADYIESVGVPVVIKADGLAAGKGVVIAETEREALRAVHDMLSGNRFGEAGSKVVIEQFLVGEEASFICIVDGEFALPMATSQDHKARDEGDVGPNTGGMGAYSPAPVVTDSIHQRIMREVINPTVDGMASDGQRFRGFLYAGLMISEDGAPRVIEFNVRLGDPETQPLLMRLESDLCALCLAAIDGDLASYAETNKVDWSKKVALGVVLAAGGYPDAYAKGQVITGLESTPTGTEVKVFHAGTKAEPNPEAHQDAPYSSVTTDGGRVLCVTALGSTVREASTAAYEAVAKIHWQDVYFRKDIGHRAIARET